MDSTSRTRFFLLLVTTLLAACDPEQTVLTLSIPGSASGRIERVQIDIFPSDSEVCSPLAMWGTGSCRLSCGETSPPDAGPPEVSLVLERGPESFEERPELSLGEGTSWEVRVIAETGSGSLYGCASLEASNDATLELWYPWCSVRACGQRFHEACQAELVCGTDALEDPLEPQCELTGLELIEVWEQEGLPCSPPAAEGRCRPALVSCTEDLLEPLEDGVCPTDEPEPCVAVDSGRYVPEQDYNCDGAHPSCEEECDPETETERSCGEGDCVGVSFCVDGDWSDCVFSSVEYCNGVDDDCDTDVDEGETPLLGCNRGRQSETPAADSCVEGTCRCGASRACGESQACCDAECVDVLSDAAHCGGCDMRCDRGTTCQRGQCRETTVEEDCTETEDCNTTWVVADTCSRGVCLCGRATACEDRLMCCDGACVDTTEDPRNCGRCGVRCSSGLCYRSACRG